MKLRVLPDMAVGSCAWRSPFEAALPGLEAWCLGRLLGTRDAAEGLDAFLEKRPPRREHR